MPDDFDSSDEPLPEDPAALDLPESAVVHLDGDPHNNTIPNLRIVRSASNVGAARTS
jgi:hypothetical protein